MPASLRKESSVAASKVTNFCDLQLFVSALSKATSCCEKAVSGSTNHLRDLFILSRGIWNFSIIYLL